MPLLRKLIKVGNSRAVVIPPSWIELHEKKTGQILEEVMMEVDGVITLRPYPQDNLETGK